VIVRGQELATPQRFANLTAGAADAYVGPIHLGNHAHVEFYVVVPAAAPNGVQAAIQVGYEGQNGPYYDAQAPVTVAPGQPGRITLTGPVAAPWVRLRYRRGGAADVSGIIVYYASRAG